MSEETNIKENKNIFVTRPSIPSLEEYVDEIRDIWKTRWLTNMGVKHEELREELKIMFKI